jgi:ribonuclease BN (tRNA processing enzyme)
LFCLFQEAGLPSSLLRLTLALAAPLMAQSALAAQKLLPQTTCPAFVWTTLGTAGGPVPTPDRAEPSNLLVLGRRAILVDTGDGTVNQLARIGRDSGGIDTVVISHLHLDHTGGLAAVIGLRWMNQYPGVLTIYGPPGTAQVVQGIVASMAPPARIGFGLGQLPANPASSLRVIEIDDGAMVDLGDGASIKAAANSHFDHDGHGDPGNVSLSYRFDFAGRSLAYTGDTGPSEAVTRLAQGATMLVSEVILTDALIQTIRTLRKDAPEAMLSAMARHLSTHHLPPQDIGAMAARAKVGAVVLTHMAIPGPIAQSAQELRAGVARDFAGPVMLARDLQDFPIACAQPSAINHKEAQP